MNVLAPIVVFTYNRPNHTQRTVESLLKNPLAKISDLIIFSDAATSRRQRQAVDEVRSYLSELTGFRSVKVIHRDKNFGLAESIIQGVTEVLEQSEKVIVLEDDMVVSPHFLKYMNEALEQFVDDDRVISVHGYVYPVDIELPEAFFIRGADCWGWATWRRGWEIFNPNGKYLLDELTRRGLLRFFDFNSTSPHSKMLKEQIKGGNDSWAVRWYASAFLANKLTLYPGRSLVNNIGNDSSGTHCVTSEDFDVGLSKSSINLKNVIVEVSPIALEAFEYYYKNNNSWRKQFINIVLSFLKMNHIKVKTKDWLPPVLHSYIKSFVGIENNTSFEGNYNTWEEADALCNGYGNMDILEKVLSATMKVKNGEAVYERDSVIFDQIEYSWPVLTGLMCAAAQNSGCLKVLDFGGSLGSSYFENRLFLNSLPNFSWNIVEQTHFVVAGKKHIQDKNLRFFETIDDCVQDIKPNAILLSSVLQYLRDPGKIIDTLIKIGSDVILIDRTIVNSNSVNNIYIQHVPSTIYSASYPCYSLSESWLLNRIGKTYDMAADFTSLDFPALRGINSEFKGYIFKKRA